MENTGSFDHRFNNIYVLKAGVGGLPVWRRSERQHKTEAPRQLRLPHKKHWIITLLNLYLSMKRGNKKYPRGNSRQNSIKEDTPTTENVDTANKLTLADHEDMEAIQTNIIAEIQAVRLDVKKELKEAIGTLKSELMDFRGEVNAKLNGIASELKETTDRVESMEQRVAEMEECNSDHAEMLTYTLELQQTIQAQLTDLEA